MKNIRKPLYIALGVLCVSLGVLGIFLPLLPSTVFFLLAAFFFSRSSNRALHWLLNNRWFGVYIRNYREGRGIALREKIISLSVLWLTIGYSAIFITDTLWVRLLLLAVAVGVTIHLVTLKTYRPEAQPLPPMQLAEHEQPAD